MASHTFLASSSHTDVLGIVFVSASAAEGKKNTLTKVILERRDLIWLRIPGHSPQQGSQGDENLKQPVTSHHSQG